MAKLTKRSVESAHAEGREAFVWDHELPGFGVRVFASGKRSYVVQYRHVGRTKRLVLGAHGVLTPDQARTLAMQRLAEVRQGIDPAAARDARASVTVAALAERYAEEHLPKKKPSSRASDARLIARRIVPALGSRPVEGLTRDEVARWHHSMRATPIEANRALAVLSKMLRLAETWGLRKDAAALCRVQRNRERRRGRLLTPAELGRLGGVLAEAERLGTEPPSVVGAVRLLLFTGARRGEIAGLRWSEVDVAGACLRLADSKTGAKVVPLNAPAQNVLANMPRVALWVFPTASRRGPVSLSKPWERIRRRAGLADVRIHDLRHGFASVGAASGQSLLIVGALLGQRAVSMTERYSHLPADVVSAASEQIGARIASALSATPTPDVVPLRAATVGGAAS